MLYKTKRLFGKMFFSIFLLGTFFSVLAIPKVSVGMPIRVDIVNDAGQSFRQYPTGSGHNVKRAYIQATNRQQYNIRVRNMTGQRIAVVVTVDGRNILSGKKSWLRSNEKMYLLEPYQTSVYKGWRTGKNRINRFFFTESGNSYAGAWGDKSAMGVIAVVAFYEKRRYRTPLPMAPAPMFKSRRSDAGTGYGRTQRSDSTTVRFTPERNSVAKFFYKYEWRSKLCQRGIIVCHRRPAPRPNNRFWNETNQGYAPPPPR